MPSHGSRDSKKVPALGDKPKSQLRTSHRSLADLLGGGRGGARKPKAGKGR